MSRNLIIYYSRKGENYVNGRIESLKKGNTEICAEYIKNSIGGDLFEIEPVSDYSSNYRRCTEEAQDEISNNSRPKLKKYLNDIDGYGNIFICGPCWWGTYPMAVFSLIESLDFKDKNVFPLMTHEGSGLGKSVSDLKRICNGANIKDGLAIHGADAGKSEPIVSAWVKKNITE